MKKHIAIILGLSAAMISFPAAAQEMHPELAATLADLAAQESLPEQPRIAIPKNADENSQTEIVNEKLDGSQAPTIELQTSSVVEEGDKGTYVAKDSLYLPDPLHSEYTDWASKYGENIIADNLNKSLDIWRICGWDGGDAAAAAFNAWARTHEVGDEAVVNRTTIAWKPFGRISEERTGKFDRATKRIDFCEDISEQHPFMKEEMDRQVDALAKAHSLAHR